MMERADVRGNRRAVVLATVLFCSRWSRGERDDEARKKGFGPTQRPAGMESPPFVRWTDRVSFARLSDRCTSASVRAESLRASLRRMTATSAASSGARQGVTHALIT